MLKYKIPQVFTLILEKEQKRRANQLLLTNFWMTKDLFIKK